jgi:hypothetical protein
MGKDLSPVIHEAVSSDEAMAIVDGYFSRLRPKYDFAEEAIAETMFGFQRSKTEFVEICINGPSAISFRYQVSESRKVLFLTVPMVYQKERTLQSREDTKEKVRAFFELDSNAFKSEIKR